MDVSDTESATEHPHGQQVRIILDSSSSASWSELGSEVSSSEDDSGEHEGPGLLCDVKKLYEGENKCGCCINWVEEIPEDVGPSAEEESESRRHALLIRLRRNHNDGKAMVLHSIVIQSSYLKSILGEVFQEYSGITTTLKKLVFKAPFHCFFYEWHRLEKIFHEIDDPVRKSHARLLRKVLRSELKETISLSNDLSHNGVITYDYLWTIFKPGIDIYTFEDGYHRIYRLQNTVYASGIGTQYFQLTVHEIDCEGDGFGYQWKIIPIHSFPGTRSIQDLDAFPTSCHPRLGEVKEELKKRGEKFRSIHLQPYYYGAYKGIVIDGKHKRNVDGRIVVDPSSFATFTDGVTGLIPFDSTALKQGMDVSDQTHQPPPPPPPFRGPGMPRPPMPGFVQPPIMPPHWGHPPPPPAPQIMRGMPNRGSEGWPFNPNLPT